MAEPPNPERHSELLIKYAVPNMGDYSIVGSELSSILDRLDRNNALSLEDKRYIREKGLFDLCEFVKRLEETNKHDFQYLRSRQLRSPNRRKLLWRKYGTDFIDGAHVRQMMQILEEVEIGSRVSDVHSFGWLRTTIERPS